jgi:hypothetical protein
MRFGPQKGTARPFFFAIFGKTDRILNASGVFSGRVPPGLKALFGTFKPADPAGNPWSGIG